MKLRRSVLVLVALVAVIYLLGGVQGIRRIRNRVRAWMEPPTAAEMQRATRDTTQRAAALPTRTPEGKEIPLSEPPSIATIVAVIAGVMVLAVGVMYATGRGGARRT